ncbi:MAG: SDR family NAD(P)-dependent oxidoreductase [Pseudomonadota bacterium]
MTIPSHKRALVFGASGGIGSAIVDTIDARADFSECIGLARQTADFDLLDEASIEHQAATLQGQEFDLIFVATGALATSFGRPEKSFSALSPDAMHQVLAINTVGVALLIKHFGPLLAKGRRAVFANLSARVGSIEDNRLGGWISYRASKAAVNQVMRCAAVEFGRTRKQSIFASLHPGTIESGLTKEFARGKYTATPEECATNLLSVLDSLEPEQSGRFFAYDGSTIPW